MGSAPQKLTPPWDTKSYSLFITWRNGPSQVSSAQFHTKTEGMLRSSPGHGHRPFPSLCLPPASLPCSRHDGLSPHMALLGTTFSP